MKRRNIIWHRTGNVNSERESAKECARYYGAGESKGTFMYWAALSLRGYNSQIPLTSSIFIAGTKSGECREKNKKTKKKTNKKPRRRKKCVWCLLVVGSADGAIVIDCTTAAVDGPFSDATRYNIWAAHNAAVTLRQLARIDESKSFATIRLFILNCTIRSSFSTLLVSHVNTTERRPLLQIIVELPFDVKSSNGQRVTERCRHGRSDEQRWKTAVLGITEH